MSEYFTLTFKFLKEIAPTVSLYSPLIITFIAGLWINRRLERYKAKLLVDQSVIKRRADTYFKIKDDLNTIYIYIKRVGGWRDLTPEKVIELKRKVDKEIYCTKPFWSKELINKYLDFMNVCFKTNRGHGRDAAIIADVTKYNDLPGWDGNSNELFSDGFSEEELDKSYELLLNAFSREFGVE